MSSSHNQPSRYQHKYLNRKHHSAPAQLRGSSGRRTRVRRSNRRARSAGRSRVRTTRWGRSPTRTGASATRHQTWRPRRSADFDGNCCLTERGQAFSISGVLFTSFAIFAILLCFINYCGNQSEENGPHDSQKTCFGIYSKFNGTTPKYQNVVKAFHITALICSLGAMIAWCYLVNFREYATRNIPVYFAFIFNTLSELTIISAAAVWTANTKDSAAHITYLIFLWLAGFFLFITCILSLCLFIGVKTNTDVCCNCC